MIEIKEKESNQLERDRILNKAHEIINGERQGTYGSAEDSFSRIAEFWTAYTGNYISATDVANMMVLMKIARNASGVYKDDNWIDICGYAALGGEIQKRAYDDRSTIRVCSEEEHDDKPDAINRLINIGNEIRKIDESVEGRHDDRPDPLRYSGVIKRAREMAKDATTKENVENKQWFTLDDFENYQMIMPGTYLHGIESRYGCEVDVHLENNDIERFICDVANAYNFGFDGTGDIVEFVNMVGKLFREQFPFFNMTVVTAVEIVGMCYLHVVNPVDDGLFDIYRLPTI